MPDSVCKVIINFRNNKMATGCVITIRLLTIKVKKIGQYG